MSEKAAEGAEETPQADATRRVVYVNSLPVECSEDEVRQLFQDCGKIQEIKLLKKKGYTNTIAFITYETAEGSKKAVSTKNGLLYKTLCLKVQIAKRDKGYEPGQKPPQSTGGRQRDDGYDQRRYDDYPPPDRRYDGYSRYDDYPPRYDDRYDDRRYADRRYDDRRYDDRRYDDPRRDYDRYDDYDRRDYDPGYGYDDHDRYYRDRYYDERRDPPPPPPPPPTMIPRMMSQVVPMPGMMQVPRIVQGIVPGMMQIPQIPQGQYDQDRQNA